jgi:hypothetical protein
VTYEGNPRSYYGYSDTAYADSKFRDWQSGRLSTVEFRAETTTGNGLGAVYLKEDYK